MIDRVSIFLLAIASFIGLTIASDSNSTDCVRICAGKSVNYPFGFSDGCEFRLNCSASGEMVFKGYAIRNITYDALLLKFPPNCSRPIEEIKQVYGKNSALSLQNGLLLRNCSSPLNECVVPSSLIENRFGPDRQCQIENGRGQNLSCYTSQAVKAEILSYTDIISTGCKFIYSSFVVEDSDETFEDYSDLSLDFRAIQVAWWVSGTCRCDRNANCTTIGSDGYRCRCIEGFTGDGFVQGKGCRPGEFLICVLSECCFNFH
uniref:NELL2-like EGF domain-containing protein n=1 Tax=Opuntia streptacantha TaxID=393608 RepID=A0A7C9A5H4_OPUST